MLFYRGHSVSLRRVVLLTGDIAAIVVALFLSATLRLGFYPGIEYLVQHIASLAASVAIFIVVFYVVGMYERQALTRRHGFYVLPLVGTAIGMAFVILIFYARFQFQVGRGILLISGAFIFLLTWGLRHLYRAVVRSGMLSKKALIIGDGREAIEVAHLLQANPDSGYKVRGVIAARKIQPGTLLAGLPVVGTIERIRELVNAFDAETLVVATSLSREPAILRALRPLRCSGTEIIDYVTLHEMLAQEIPVDHINDEWLMSAAMNSSVIHVRKIKRILDFVTASIGLILGAPIMLLTALLIRLDSRGPILYRQRRAGLDGRIITVLKFRSMRVDAESESGAVWATSKDPRVTRVGRFIRKWRIDELPQLINVLRGEMSLVGPRPERPEFIETLAAAIPFYRERLMVPPGITGWAQVKYPYAASVEAAKRKLQFDLYYIKHMSLFLDIMILLRTFKTIIVGLRHSEEEVTEPAAGGAITVLPPSAVADGKIKTA
jgi:exopolysaccharide biosynthesis polyprenyl glycosylphosphotransferase